MPNFDLDMLPVSSPPTPGRVDNHPRVVVINEFRALFQLVALIVARSGMSQSEIARHLGIKVQSLNQYSKQRRMNPSVAWLSRLANLCGARIVVEWPPEGLKGAQRELEESLNPAFGGLIDSAPHADSPDQVTYPDIFPR